MKKRAYLAGPMSGQPDFNYPLFEHVTARLRYAGFDMFSPHEHGLQVLGSLDKIKAMHPVHLKAAVRRLLAFQLNWIALHADIVFFLPGWESSKGSRAEHATAIACDIEIKQVPDYFLPEGASHGGDHDHSADKTKDTGSHLYTA